MRATRRSCGRGRAPATSSAPRNTPPRQKRPRRIRKTELPEEPKRAFGNGRALLFPPRETKKNHRRSSRDDDEDPRWTAPFPRLNSRHGHQTLSHARPQTAVEYLLGRL